jgi:RND family efflux transporter MFP subunit
VRAEFGVIEQEVNSIMPGQTAFVEVDAYPNKQFHGVVDRVSPIVTGTSRTANTEIKIPNDEGFLLPGMSVRISILLYSKKNAIIIPTEAVLDFNGVKSVFVINETTVTAELRQIEVEYSQSDYCVVASGLAKDELIALDALDKLSDGASVDLIEKREL